MEIIQERQLFSGEILGKLNDEVGKIEEIQSQLDYCIYVTGSYARKEASKFSDLDLFFINKNSESGVSRINKIHIDSKLIYIANSLGIPPFSGDGEYLEIHDLDKIMSELGSPNDDYKNYFTARLLLLLESYPVYNEKFFNEVLEQIIGTYYRDFHDHVKDFEPIFLVNDIIRFWRTLCLNYEHKRNRLSKGGKKDFNRINKSHIKNLKLRFSRKLTCFSFLLQILSIEQVVSKEIVFAISKQTPIERLKTISIQNPKAETNIKTLLGLYEEFLDFTGCAQDELEDKIGDEVKRNAIFEKSKIFGKELYSTMTGLEKNDLMMYLVI